MVTSDELLSTIYSMRVVIRGKCEFHTRYPRRQVSTLLTGKTKHTQTHTKKNKTYHHFRGRTSQTNIYLFGHTIRENTIQYLDGLLYCFVVQKKDSLFVCRCLLLDCLLLFGIVKKKKGHDNYNNNNNNNPTLFWYVAVATMYEITKKILHV